MVLSEEEITRLLRIRKTVMQMLRDRNYLVGDFEINLTKEQFRNKYGENMKREDLIINKSRRNDSSDQVFAYSFHQIHCHKTNIKKPNILECVLVYVFL